MITNIDPPLRSKLDNIHLVVLFQCNLLKVYSIDKILTPFCEDLQKLSEIR